LPDFRTGAPWVPQEGTSSGRSWLDTARDIFVDLKSQALAVVGRWSWNMWSVYYASGIVDIDRVDGKGYTRLMRSVEQGDLNTAECLIACKADVNLSNSDGLNALKVVAKKSLGYEFYCVDAAKLLVDAGAEVNEKDNFDTFLRFPMRKKREPSVLRLAARNGNLSLVKYLIFQAGASVHKRVSPDWNGGGDMTVMEENESKQKRIGLFLLVRHQKDIRDALRKHVPKLAMLHPEIEKAVLGTTPAPRIRSLPKAPRPVSNFRRVQWSPFHPEMTILERRSILFCGRRSF